MLAKVLQAGKVKLFLKLENIPMKAKNRFSHEGRDQF